MILNTEKKTIELKFSTRNVVRMLEAVKADDVKVLVFEGMHKMDTKLLANVIQQLAVTPERSLTDIYGFIDDYKAENECSIKDIYQMIITELNDNYFFDKKMSAEEVEELAKNPLMTGMDSIVQQAVRDAVGKIAQQSVLAPLT